MCLECDVHALYTLYVILWLLLFSISAVTISLNYEGREKGIDRSG